MNKEIVLSSVAEALEMKSRLVRQAEEAVRAVQAIAASKQTAIDTICALKFERVIDDRLFDEKLNFIEYLNQTFTYLVCLTAGIHLLKESPERPVTIRFGIAAGYDVEAGGGKLIGECFAATSVKSNSKLKNDLLRLQANHVAQEKYAFFYTRSTSVDQTYIGKMRLRYPGITLVEFSYKELTEIS